MQSLFDRNTYHDVINRIDLLNENSRPKWGKMNVNQMIKHCQMPLLVANGKIELEEDIGFVKKLMMKLYKTNMYNDKPWPKNLGTPKRFKIEDTDDFEKEREKLKIIISEFHEKALNIRWPAHPYFGKFTTDQWGKLQYKHLEHHLHQFGV